MSWSDLRSKIAYALATPSARAATRLKREMRAEVAARAAAGRTYDGIRENLALMTGHSSDNLSFERPRIYSIGGVPLERQS